MIEILLKCDLAELDRLSIPYSCSFRNKDYTSVYITEEDYDKIKYLLNIYYKRNPVEDYYYIGYGAINGKWLKLLLNPEGRRPEPNEYIFSAMDYEPSEVEYQNFEEYLADELGIEEDQYEQAQVIYHLAQLNQMSIGYLLWSIM